MWTGVDEWTGVEERAGVDKWTGVEERAGVDKWTGVEQWTGVDGRECTGPHICQPTNLCQWMAIH